MTCLHSKDGTVVICRPRRNLSTRMINCPTCGMKRKMLIEELGWYGFDKTCLSCGERWQDGYQEQHYAKFDSQWRQENIDRARQMMVGQRMATTEAARRRQLSRRLRADGIGLKRKAS